MNRFWIFFACSLVLHLAVAALLISRTSLPDGFRSGEGAGEEVQIHTETPLQDPVEGSLPGEDPSPPSPEKESTLPKEVLKPAPPPQKTPRPKVSKKTSKPKNPPPPVTSPPPLKKQKTPVPPPSKPLKPPKLSAPPASADPVREKTVLPPSPPPSDLSSDIGEAADIPEKETDIKPPPPVLSPPSPQKTPQQEQGPPDSEPEELIDSDEILKEEVLPPSLPADKQESPSPGGEEGKVFSEDEASVPGEQSFPREEKEDTSSPPVVPLPPKPGGQKLSGPGSLIPKGQGGEKTREGSPQQGFEPSKARGYRQLVQMSGNPLPVYPQVALEKKWEGRVEVIYYVNTAGLVEKIQVYRSSLHKVLDNSALQALARYRYKPGQEGWVSHPVDFILDQHQEVKITTPLRTK